MATGNEKLYYVGVQFSNSRAKYSYICTDLTVKVGDQVIVPVYGGDELRATVVTAQFYSPNEVPYPIEKTKKVIRKVEPEQEKAEAGKPVTVLENEVQTETRKDKLYFVGVRFIHGYNVFPYICTDLSVKVGDQVIVPVYSGEELKATVVTAQFCYPDEVPHPFKTMLTVIRKVEPEKEKTLEGKPVSVVAKEKATQPEKKQGDVTNLTKKKKRSVSASDVIATIFTLMLAIPFYTVIFSFLVCIPLAVLGLNISDGGGWLPIIIAFPIAIYACIRSLKKQGPSGSTQRGTYYKNSNSSNEAGGGWYPGCPEDSILSSTDSLFDYDGDGHLDAFESSSRYDAFFGDDE